MTTVAEEQHIGLQAPAAGSWLQPATRAGLIDLAPFVASIIPFAMTIGATIAASQVDNLVGFLGAPMIIGGTSQLAAITLLDAGAAALGVVITALAINLRVAVYSAVLAPKFGVQPRWFRWAGAAMIVDQTFAVVDARIDEGRDPAWIRRYYGTNAIGLALVFIVFVGVGVLVGPAIPVSWELSFAGIVMFFALLIPSVTSRSTRVAAVVATALAIVLVDLPNGFGLVVAGLAGAGSGALVSRSGR